jgi:hypothetical protein
MVSPELKDDHNAAMPATGNQRTFIIAPASSVVAVRLWDSWRGNRRIRAVQQAALPGALSRASQYRLPTLAGRARPDDINFAVLVRDQVLQLVLSSVESAFAGEALATGTVRAFTDAAVEPIRREPSLAWWTAQPTGRPLHDIVASLVTPQDLKRLEGIVGDDRRQRLWEQSVESVLHTSDVGQTVDSDDRGSIAMSYCGLAAPGRGHLLPAHWLFSATDVCEQDLGLLRRVLDAELEATSFDRDDFAEAVLQKMAGVTAAEARALLAFHARRYAEEIERWRTQLATEESERQPDLPTTPYCIAIGCYQHAQSAVQYCQQHQHG